MLPVLFIVLASAALLAALAALFASLRASLGGGGAEEASWSSAGPDRGALEDEKNALLRALKDLEYEHEVGKIDDDDYARLERAYRARAKEVLGELDHDLRPYLSRAEELAAAGGSGESKSEKKKGKKAKKKAEPDAKAAASESVAESESKGESKGESRGESESKGESAAKSESESKGESESDDERAIATPVCPKCATANDADARFCKKCATPLGVAEVAS